jgi:hypothetical protein
LLLLLLFVVVVCCCCFSDCSLLIPHTHIWYLIPNPLAAC